MKNKLIFIFLVIFLALAGVFVYLRMNNNEENSDNPQKESEIFNLSEEDNPVWNEELELSDDQKRVYSERIEQAESALEAGFEETEDMTEQEFKVAHFTNLGLYYGYLGDYEKSYGYYLDALEQDGEDRLTWLGLGDLLVKMNAPKSAENAYKKALELNPYAALNYIKLADLYKKQNFGDERVEEVYKEGIDKVMEDDQLWSLYAEWLTKQGRNEEAIEKYEKLKEKQPENTEAIEKKIEKLKK